MNDIPGERPDLRVSDADRDAAISELGEHYQTGRLDNEEFGQRLDAAATAKTRGELDRLLADLPRLAAPAPGPAPQRGRQVAATVAVVAAITAAALAVTVATGAFGAWQGHMHGGWHGGWHGGGSVWLIVIPVVLILRAARRARGPGSGPR